MKTKNLKMKTIYYKPNGEIDKTATWINNNNWFMPIFVIICFILGGIVENL